MAISSMGAKLIVLIMVALIILIVLTILYFLIKEDHEEVSKFNSWHRDFWLH